MSTVDTAPFGWAYCASIVLSLLLAFALVALVGWLLDRACGRYDEHSTSLSGRSRSSAPDDTRPVWAVPEPRLNAEPRPLRRPVRAGGDPS